ncbi:LysR family transcriptional regulator [Ihubacter massiliensis]|uniref:LysR family transcriptional regulator n=1 Tax=Hominibacterium faecale TaxID=2839743 RepID=A0A9J6QT59_9FIRM|nr:MULTISPECIES: LysR family transcriptional regulator [Eubacteriales Family XIII. Incertae Sedis]MCI7302412.1 LysR family transcriptional regulator [Clostridia bacterium]MDE8733847.1 LysR family transcriptional regulator [Eubacteriales bacterium DFI.9.88]MDY3011079.1 LysR family transcriptional regulator [Clostridiales Family XIII bacterium]MCO7123782.1 LysR family transcriptional regulator [Ihubacter massiliensis]MCU7378708.1 LysR family transcriptional regulator [Hominibacterium faecale]
MNIVPSSYVLAAAQYKSISKAAEKLGISQPALSAHLKKIEDQLGITIFDRSHKPLTLTDAGDIYLHYAKQALELDKAFEQRISDLNNLATGNLVLGGASFFNVSYLPKAVAEYTRRYPGIKIQVVDGKMPEIIEKALNNEIDLFISPPWQQDDRFSYERFLSERIFICVPPKWPINDALAEQRLSIDDILSDRKKEEASLKTVDFKRFENEPFVLLKDDQHIGNMMKQLFERHGFPPKRSVEVEQTITSYAFTLAGVGISLMTASTIKNSHLQDYPAFYLTDPDICQRDMFIAYPKQKYLSRACKEFVAVLKDSLESFG